MLDLNHRIVPYLQISYMELDFSFYISNYMNSYFLKVSFLSNIVNKLHWASGILKNRILLVNLICYFNAIRNIQLY